MNNHRTGVDAMDSRSAIAIAAEKMCREDLLPCAHAVAAAHKRGKGADGYRYHSIQGCIRSAAVLGRVSPECLEHLQQALFNNYNAFLFFSAVEPNLSLTQAASFASLNHRNVHMRCIIYKEGGRILLTAAGRVKTKFVYHGSPAPLSQVKGRATRDCRCCGCCVPPLRKRL